MRAIGGVIIGVCLLARPLIAQTSSLEPFRPVATMKQLMLEIVHPASNDILLAVNRGPLRSDQEWAAVRRSALTLAESGNLLIVRNRASEWVTESRSLIDVASEAYKAADAKDSKALNALADRLDATCTSCHRKFRLAVFPAR